MFGDIKVKSRPLRLAFFIPPERAALQKCIQINSSLWGGSYNPIISLHKRAPKEWRLYPGQKISIEERVLGYVRAFDPDVFVGVGKGLPQYLQNLGRPIVGIDEIWKQFERDKLEGAPSYGVGVFELLNGIYEKYFEIKRRFPMKVLLPVIPNEHQLFWSAAVGQLPQSIQEVVEGNYSEAIDIEKPTISTNNYASILKREMLFPRRITHYGLRNDRRDRGRNDAYGFYMDASRVTDIIDFWNLRALGRAVIPIPKQFVKVPEFLEFIRGFVKSQYRVSRRNPAVSYGTNIVRSFSCAMPELEDLARDLDLANLIPGNPTARSLALQHWYPRIWDEWAMGKDGATPDDVFSQVEEYSFQETDGLVSLNLLKPDFVSDVLADLPRYANEIYPNFYGEGDATLADVLPYEHGKEVLRVVGGSIALEDEFRIGHTGLVNLVRWRSRTRWKLPLAEDVFLAWLKDKGFNAELSTCGRVARQIHTQLRGWTNPLTNEALVKLLEQMNQGGEDGKGASLGQVKTALKGVSASGRLYRSLVDHGVFQLGYKTQCTHCYRSSWHSLNSLATGLECPLCHKQLDAISAVDSENKGAWHLKTAGPFSIGNYGDGSYSVLLGLNFFDRDHSLQTTPVMSFKAEHAASSKTLEADFALMWQETVYGETQEGVLFAECKSYGKFEKKDFDRMEIIADQFPGAILAFCTLRRKFEPNEIKRLKQLTKKGMKYWKTDRPINPVLILTGQELFSHFGAPYCWKNLTIPDWVKQSHTVLNLCNATQAIYLGEPHWQETWHKEFEKRQQRKKLKSP